MLDQLVIKPTVYCYHKCPYCDLRQDYYADMLVAKKREREKEQHNLLPVTAPPKLNPGHMPLEMALRTIDEAAALGMNSLQLSGGDPLMYPHLLDLIRAGKRHPGVFVFMNSVGTGVTVKKAREIIDAGLGAWNFSVDTLNPEVYERLRGVKNALPTIMTAIKTVREAAADSPEFRINYMTVITRVNFRDLPGLLEHCLATGVASIYLMNVYGDETGEALLTESEIGEFRGAIVPSMLAILKEANVSAKVLDNANWVLNSFFSRDNTDANYARGTYWLTKDAVKQACQTPNHYALIEPDGSVLPCCLVEIAHEGVVGNVTNRSLQDVWNGEDYTRFRDERIEFCQKCSSPSHKTLGLIDSMCRQFNVWEER